MRIGNGRCVKIDLPLSQSVFAKYEVAKKMLINMVRCDENRDRGNKFTFKLSDGYLKIGWAIAD